MTGEARTLIYKRTASGDDLLASVMSTLLARSASCAGRARRRSAAGTADGRIFRRTAHDERELGSFSANGAIHSHGLFEGGELGWVEPDGVVIQGGLILGEEEVGRVEGSGTMRPPQPPCCCCFYPTMPKRTGALRLSGKPYDCT